MLTSGNGQHRRPRPTPAAVVRVATVAATGAGIALPLIGATAAHAAGNGTWDRVAVCETGGMWSADTGNGFFGGLAITQTTWDEYGGDAYAARPDLASRVQQIAVAEKILAELGPDAWPGCAQQTGLLGDGASPGSPTLPGLPRPHAGHGTPSHATPGAPDDGLPSEGDPADAGTPAASAHPSHSAHTPGAPGGTASASPTPSTSIAASDGPSGTASDPSTPVTGVPSSGASGIANTPGIPGVSGLPGATTPPGASAATPGGRHARPYAPTDEQLAAADRMSRTEVYGTTGIDATDVPIADNANRTGQSGTSVADGRRGYTVDPGDSLAGIAASQHVDGGWHALYDANHQMIGDDPNLIKPGQILNLG